MFGLPQGVYEGLDNEGRAEARKKYFEAEARGTTPIDYVAKRLEEKRKKLERTK